MNTVELLELIILQLPCRQILAAQRVCKLWRDTIEGSHSSQLALCLTSIEPKTFCEPGLPDEFSKTEVGYLKGEERTKILLGGGNFRDASVQSPCAGAMVLRMKRNFGDSMMTINPIICDLFPSRDGNGDLSCTVDLLRSRLKTPPSTWARTYITQPPMPEIVLCMIIEVCKANSSEQEPVHFAFNAMQHNWVLYGEHHSCPKLMFAQHFRFGKRPKPGSHEAQKVKQSGDWNDYRRYRIDHPPTVTDLLKACNQMVDNFLRQSAGTCALCERANEPPTVVISFVVAM